MYFMFGPCDATEVDSFSRPPPVHASSKQTNYSQESSNISTLSPLLARVFQPHQWEGRGEGSDRAQNTVRNGGVIVTCNALQCNATQTKPLQCHALHWCIPNLFSRAKELVCGGSPIVCVLVEYKVQYGGNGSNSSREPVWISCA